MIGHRYTHCIEALRLFKNMANYEITVNFGGAPCPGQIRIYIFGMSATVWLSFMANFIKYCALVAGNKTTVSVYEGTGNWCSYVGEQQCMDVFRI